MTRYPGQEGLGKAVGLKTTVSSSSTRRDGSAQAHPPALLQFYPLGDPPTMHHIALDGEEVTIGRAQTCSVQLDDDEASRQHARLRLVEGAWHVEDLESTNGVYVNGRKVTSARLSGGEVVRVGSSLFRFFSAGLAAHDVVLDASGGPIVAGPSFEATRDLLDRAAESDLSVLIAGETGTGKELAARQLHRAGPRAKGPFVAVNCAAIPVELLESELFGHAKGAFTGASSDRVGLLQEASGGTLFLDEIAELPLVGQAKLLRVLQDKQVRPVGAARTISIDLRVVSACNRDLPVMIRQDRFRRDLYARVAELVIKLPPLRHRVEDVPLLAEHFIRVHGHGQTPRLSTGALEHLCTQRWRQNVRELESAVRRALLMAGESPSLEKRHFVGLEEPASSSLAETNEHRRDSLRKAGGAARQEELLRRQTQELEGALRRHNGSVEAAAAELGISRSQLYRRASKLGVEVASFRR